jgi:hypothetical protein
VHLPADDAERLAVQQKITFAKGKYMTALPASCAGNRHSY